MYSEKSGSAGDYKYLQIKKGDGRKYSSAVFYAFFSGFQLNHEPLYFLCALLIRANPETVPDVSGIHQ